MNFIQNTRCSFRASFITLISSTLLLVACSADDGATKVVNGPGGGGGAVPTVMLTATPNAVAPGGTFVLDYTTTNAESCVASGAWTGDVGTNGSRTITVPATAGNYTYTLTCTGSNGQQTAESITVIVTGGGSGDDGGVQTDPTGPLPNDGTTPTVITEDDTPIDGHFICTASARAYGPAPVTEVRVNGLVGSQLTDLLNLLGAGTVTQLLNSVTAKELVVDGDLSTAAQYNLTAGLLGGLISSIDLYVGLNSAAPVGQYAVFGLTFPIATAELSLVQSVTITTYSGTTVLESVEIDASTIDLVGAVATGDTAVYFGLKAVQPYDGVTISLNPALISTNVGNAMNVNELCTDGYFVP